MDYQASESLEKIRQQFDAAPYPRNPLDQSPKDEANLLFIHNLVTPYYLNNQKFIETEGKVILDAGCGTGYASLVLAEANPGTQIIGTDISEASIKLARQRLEYHGFNNAEFYVISMEELPKLELQFDYINCDEVLYLLPDPILGLQVMKSVLKPGGIIRANLHSLLNRFQVYQAQEVFKMMGLMEHNPEQMEMELVRETMMGLKDQVLIKHNTWQQQPEDEEYFIRMNYLLQEDKGYTIPEMFSALKEAGLDFLSMVQWRQWEVMELFKDPDNLPVFLGMSFPEMSIEERLHLFELLHPVHRLLDFWCVHLGEIPSYVPLEQWELSDWQSALVNLHPHLRTSQLKEDLLNCITTHRHFEISRYLSAPTQVPITIDSSIAVCLLPLWEGVQPIMSLVERWLKVRPVNPVTLELVSEKVAFNEVKELLHKLETFLYVLLQRSRG